MSKNKENKQNKKLTKIIWKDIPAAQTASNLIQTVYNGQGATVTRGEVVYISYANGSFPIVAKALANSAHDSDVIGLVLNDILNKSLSSLTQPITVEIGVACILFKSSNTATPSA